MVKYIYIRNLVYFISPSTTDQPHVFISNLILYTLFNIPQRSSHFQWELKG